MTLRSLLAAAVLLLLAGVSEAAARTPPPVGFTACALPGTEEKARCGFISVPEDRARPQGRTIRLHVMILPALDGAGREAPLFDLAGGPGEASGNSAGFYAVDGKVWRARRDVVLVDVRGAGLSGALACPGLKPATPLSRLYPPDAVRACREALAVDHDLGRYGTREAAEDLETVRLALGYERVDLFALSYGTMLAQTYMRLYPQSVRAAVLVGTVPLGEPLPLHHGANAQPVLEALIEACAADEACHHAYPDLAGDWRGLQARFADGSTTMKDKAGVEVQVERGPFMESLRALMTTSLGQARLPLVIHSAASGDLSPLLLGGGGGPALAEGLYLSVACAEGAAWITPANATEASDTFLGLYRIDEQVAACQIWSVPPVRGEALPKPEATPVLFLAGGQDHVAPPRWAREVAATYPGATVVVLPPLAHGIDGVEGIECFDEVAQAFLAAGGPNGLDTRCVATMRVPAFVVGG